MTLQSDEHKLLDSSGANSQRLKELLSELRLLFSQEIAVVKERWQLGLPFADCNFINKDIPAGVKAWGSPARIIGKMGGPEDV